MIKTEYVENGERIRHYSDSGLQIRQIETGIIYEDAIDVLDAGYTYEETDIPIVEEEVSAEEILGILLGGEAV